MEILGILLIVIFTISIIISKKKGIKEDISEGVKYEKIETLFSKSERSLLGVLKLAIEDRAIVFGKVRVADVIKPKKSKSRKEWQIAFNKISSKHFDFIICKKECLSIICAIELDDKSHESKKRKKRDDFLNKSCSSAKLPLIHIKAKDKYDINEIRKIIKEHLY